MPELAATIYLGLNYRLAYRVVRDMKLALAKDLYQELVENSFYYAPPYLTLTGFMQTIRKWPMLSLSVMDWETGTTKEDFKTYLQQTYKDHDPDEVLQQVAQWLKLIKEHKV